jgi:iron complex transport system substrate-binding protein
LIFVPTLSACRPAGDGAAGGTDIGPETPHLQEAAAQDTPLRFQAYPFTITDASGNEVAFPARPSRIISLVPSATETLLALGAQGSLVARTVFDADPTLASLPSVGGGLQPNLESLVSLDPDLVIRFAGDADPDTPARMDDFGSRHMAVRLDQIQDVRAFIADLGSVTGSHDRARTLLARIDGTLEDIRRAVEKRPRRRVAYVLGGSPPWVAGPGTFIHELLVLAGGENSFADLDALYGPVSAEELLVRSIDLIIAPEGAELLLPSSSIPVALVSPSVELPGPGLAEAARELAELLHPEAFQ